MNDKHLITLWVLFFINLIMISIVKNYFSAYENFGYLTYGFITGLIVMSAYLRIYREVKREKIKRQI